MRRTTKKDLETMLESLSVAYGSCIHSISDLSGVNRRAYRLKSGIQCFGFIPYHDYYETIQILTLLRGKRGGRGYAHRPKFLDIGCGIGNIVLLAQLAGFAGDGLEYDPKTCGIAKILCKNTEAEIFEADMNEFKNYGDYDVLYYYRPMVSSDYMDTFVRKLSKEMKPGAYVVSHGDNEMFRGSNEFLNVHHSYVWRKRGK